MTREQKKKYGTGAYRTYLVAVSSTILLLSWQAYKGWDDFRKQTEQDKAVQMEKNKNFEKEEADLHRGIVEINDKLSKKADIDYVNDLYFKHP